tara:strand:- start:200 stop:451 length:252 start_codon:yes stop_codon:yes gene_type:complete
MKLDDEVIAHIAKTIQLAILTGTDIVDHLRLMTLQENDGKVFLSDEFRENSDKNIQQMVEESERMQAENAAKGLKQPSAFNLE